MTLNANHVIAVDAALLTVGVVAVLDGHVAAAATFRWDFRDRRGLDKYGAVAYLQAGSIADFLGGYARDIPVVVEAPANRDGAIWVKGDSRVAFTGGLGTGVVVGVASALGFKRVELIAAGRHGGPGGKERKALLSRALPGVELTDEHQTDAAAIAAYWLAGRRLTCPL